MAVLEAFVYDPLINWRLLQADDARPLTGQRESLSNLSLTDKVSKFTSYFPIIASAERGPQANRTLYGQGPNRKAKADEREIFNGS